MSHQNFGIKSAHLTRKATPGFTNAFAIKKGDSIPFSIEDDEGYTYDRKLTVSVVKFPCYEQFIQFEFKDFPMYESYELNANDFVLLA